MRRTKALRLVLLGGGVAVMLASCGDNDSRARECEKARAEMRPDAEQICRRSTSSRSGSSWFFGRSGPSRSGAVTAPSQTSSSRSGFGSSARSSGGS